MRDPNTNSAEVEAAIEVAYRYFKWLKGLGWFPKKSPDVPLLRFEAHSLIARLPDVPAHLRDYVCRVLAEPPKKGKRTYAAGRDEYIREVVGFVELGGFPRTRNPATRAKEARGEPANQSRCSIVQKALARLGMHMEETNIEDISSTDFHNAQF